MGTCKVCMYKLVGSSGSTHHFREEIRVLQCEEEWEMQTRYYSGPCILKQLGGKNSSKLHSLAALIASLLLHSDFLANQLIFMCSNLSLNSCKDLHSNHIRQN